MKAVGIYISILTMALLFISGCKLSNHSKATTTEIGADSLISVVKEKIAEKKRIQKYKESRMSRDFFAKTEEYFPVIRKYSKRYGLDWRLIIAQIMKESRFKENAVSHMGARGLMQIMPYTAVEITRELDYEYIFRDPQENITAGIYHLYKQMGYFTDADYENRMKLALAAYNAGPGRVFDAQDIAAFVSGKRNDWKNVKAGLAQLTSKDWKLHLEVWELGVPPNGYFYGYTETIDYVDDIFKTYKILRKMN
jgi:membrane-bound lytic murein transglycosylase MltF